MQPAVLGAVIVESVDPSDSQPPTERRQSSLALLAAHIEDTVLNDQRPIPPRASTDLVPPVPSGPPVPNSPPQAVQSRRPRPASYHGHTAAAPHLFNGGHTSPTHSGMMMSGGIKPLHLPHIVAVSPRLSADRLVSQPSSPALPPLEPGERSTDNANGAVEGQWGSLLKRRPSDSRPRSLDLKAVSSMHARSRSVSPRQRAIFLPDVESFPENPIVTSPPDLHSSTTNAGSTNGTSSKHRRTDSLKAFAAQERESLLFRISELEAALQEVKTTDFEHSGSQQKTKDPDQTSQRHQGTNSNPVDNSDPIPIPPLAHLIEQDHPINNPLENYPSPPHSPTNQLLLASNPSTTFTIPSAKIHNEEDAHIISSLLDHTSALHPSTSISHSTGLRVLLTSPTMNLDAGADHVDDNNITNSSMINPFTSTVEPVADQHVLTSSPIADTVE